MPIITRVSKVRGISSTSMLMKEVKIVTKEFSSWGMLWLISCRRVSTSLV